MKLFTTKKIALLVIVILFIGGGYDYFSVHGSAKALDNAAETILTVTKGDLSSTVSGTSQLQPENMQVISAPASGSIKTMNLKANEPVKKGDVLLEISDPTSQENLQKAALQLKQLQDNYQSDLKQSQSLSTRATISGELTYANSIAVDAQVGVDTRIATIADASQLDITLPFLIEDAALMKVGDQVDLAVDGFMLTKTGTIESIGTTPRPDLRGGRLLDVNVLVHNDATLDAGLKASGSVTINGIVRNSQAEGMFQYVTTSSVIANTNGTISTLNFNSGDAVKKGDVIATISNDSLSAALANDQAAIDQQNIMMQNLENTLSSLVVTAPFDGEFSTDFVNQRTNVLSTYPVGTQVQGGVQFGGVANMDTMDLAIQIDELDLSKVKVGMKANVSVDSIARHVFDGVLTQLSTVGTTTNGVTDYTGVISVANPDHLLQTGMTATANILIQDEKGVLMIPIEGLQSKQGRRYVTLKNPNGTETTEEVTIGITNSTSVEITSGLKAGDKIVAPVLQKQTPTLTAAQIAALRKQFQQGAGGGGNGFGGGRGFGGGGTGAGGGFSGSFGGGSGGN